MTTPFDTDRDLKIERVLDASAEALYRCWTEVELLKQWFAPKPYTTPEAVMDVRPGGANVITMQSPDGQLMPNAGVYLEVVPNRKLVFTDAFTQSGVPSPNLPFFACTLTFEPMADGKTKYTAIARHWTKENKEAHENMGFHVGWNTCADQLEALAKTL
jgi:uncharacterized protein YndB with AHSA1/START domain